MSAAAGHPEERVGLAVSLAVLLWAAWSSAEAPRPRARLAVRGAPIDGAPLAGRAAVGGAREPRARQWATPAAGERVDFERLAFDDYDPPELRGRPGELLGVADFPAAAGALHGRDLSLAGYPLVLELEGERTSELLLTRYPPGCCFGSVPVLDEWVLVELERPVEAGELPAQVVARGRLEVGEVLDDSGFVGRLYRLQSARLEDE